MTTMRVVIAATALALWAVPPAEPAGSCGGRPPRVGSAGTATNLAISARDRAGLREAAVRCHRGGPEVVGPQRGSVYYARYRGYDWAIATFSIGAAGSTDQPERFVRRTGTRAWRDLGDTGGPLYEFGVPCPVLRAWRMPCG